VSPFVIPLGAPDLYVGTNKFCLGFGGQNLVSALGRSKGILATRWVDIISTVVLYVLQGVLQKASIVFTIASVRVVFYVCFLCYIKLLFNCLCLC
jgi:hypothetical protein